MGAASWLGVLKRNPRPLPGQCERLALAAAVAACLPAGWPASAHARSVPCPASPALAAQRQPPKPPIPAASDRTLERFPLLAGSLACCTAGAPDPPPPAALGRILDCLSWLAASNPLVRVCAVEAEDDKALLVLLDKRCAELVEGKAALQVRCDEDLGSRVQRSRFRDQADKGRAGR